MSEFIKILLSLSLSGTLLMLLVLLPKPLYRERFSRRWQYYIWLVVALRFLQCHSHSYLSHLRRLHRPWRLCKIRQRYTAKKHISENAFLYGAGEHRLWQYKRLK